MNFEIDIVLQNADAKELSALITGFTPSRVQLIDNWMYENEISLGETIPDCHAEYIDSGKILQVYGALAEGRSCGFFVYKDSGAYRFDMFFECDNASVDTRYVTEKNVDIYDSAADFIISKLADFGLTEAVLGCEMLVSHEGSVKERVMASHNPAMWIIADLAEHIEGFTSEIKDKYTVLKRKETNL